MSTERKSGLDAARGGLGSGGAVASPTHADASTEAKPHPIELRSFMVITLSFAGARRGRAMTDPRVTEFS